MNVHISSFSAIVKAAMVSLLRDVYQNQAFYMQFYQAFNFLFYGSITNRRKKVKQLRPFIKMPFRYSPKRLITVCPQKQKLKSELSPSSRDR